MTPRKFETWIAEAIEEQRASDDGTAGHGDPIRRIETNEEAGIMTTDRGLVIRFDDGSEIQLTLVQSKRARNEQANDDEEEQEDDEGADPVERVDWEQQDDGSFAYSARINGLRK